MKLRKVLESLFRGRLDRGMSRSVRLRVGDELEHDVRGDTRSLRQRERHRALDGLSDRSTLGTGGIAAFQLNLVERAGFAGTKSSTTVQLTRQLYPR